MRIRVLGLALLMSVQWLAADTVQLRNGRRVEGTFIGGDSRQVRVLATDGSVQTLDISEVETISFRSGSAGTAAASPAPAASRPAVARPETASAGGARVVVPAGTIITVRMIESIDSDVARVGDHFRASLDDPLQVGDQVIAPRNADATVALVRVEQSGKLTGRDEVSMDLYEITIKGKKYAVASSYAEVQSASRTARTGKVVGGTAALGAIIGGIAGGGRGAAIGAASGAGVGGAAQVLTKGQRVKVPSESRLEFTLKQPLAVE